MRKSEVETYYTGRERLPSVDIKVHTMWQWERVVPTFVKDNVDPRFTVEWITEHVSDEDMDTLFWHACEFEFEYFQGWADEIIPGINLEREGRSGGHMVATNLPDVETWDAIMLGKWAKLARIAREIADGIPYQVIDLIYNNDFERWATEDDARQADEAAAQLPIVAGV